MIDSLNVDNNSEQNPRKGKGIKEDNVYIRKMELIRKDSHCKEVGNRSA